jgi:membrane protease YdiL (CAAX protease family)
MPTPSRSSNGSRSVRRRATTIQQYLDVSRKPLQILAFLLPLVIAYEIGLALLLRSDHGVLTNKAHETLLRFFSAFGVAPSSGFYLGGIAVVVVLLLWHILARDPWRVDWPALAVMACESLLLALPLLLIGQLTMRLLAVGILFIGQADGSLSDLGLASKLAISVGAGLYEELMFRMLLIAIIHTLLVDVGKASQRVGAVVAVVVSAAAFTAYHPLGDGHGGLSIQKVCFFFIAGLYFGAIYVVRGFGIVVGVHAAYDVITVSLLTASTD